MVNIPDLINGILELGGGFFILINIIQLHKDKAIKGVHWVPTAYFAFWGLWNLYYYSQLDQWVSLLGGMFLVTMNTLWFCQMLYYKERR